MRRRVRPEMVQGSLACLFVLIGCALFILLFRFSWTWYHLLMTWLVSINIVAFAYYGYDKVQARSQGRRIPEVILHGLGFLGGSLGAYLGMRVFRHKTVKSSFRIIFWTIAILQVMLIVALLYRIWIETRG